MKRGLFALALVLAVFSTACAETAQQAKVRALKAFQELGSRLKVRLTKAMQQGGAAAAVGICHQEAPLIAREVAGDHGFQLGRSSHRVRNPDNTPAPEIAAYLQKYAALPAEQAPVQVLPQKSGEWLILAPIATQALCLTCHGDPATFSPELTRELRQRYPKDHATGFGPGQLRGVFWARL